MAVAAIPDSNGVIHACVVTTNGLPVTSGPNVRIIDSEAGQTCHTVAGAAPATEQALNWNQSGPTGPQGPAGQNGSNGSNGTPGQQGPQGPAVTVLSGHTLTLSGGQVLTVSGGGGTGGVTINQPPLNHTVGSGAFNTGGGPGLTFDDLLGVSFATGAHGSGGGGGAGKVAVHDISITKYVDKSSPKLALFCANGQHIPKVTITMRKAGGGQSAFLTYTLTNVLVSSYQTGGHGGSEQPTETLSLNFTKLEIKYSKQ